jgi:uncharacterized protein with GYD domain
VRREGARRATSARREGRSGPHRGPEGPHRRQRGSSETAAFVLVTKLSPESVRDPRGFQQLARQVGDRIRSQHPRVKWVSSYAILGPYDILDPFEAPDSETGTEVALLIRSMAGVTTEAYPATPWDGFLDLVGKEAP